MRKSFDGLAARMWQALELSLHFWCVVRRPGQTAAMLAAAAERMSRLAQRNFYR
jgi:hypothetical protein